MGKTQFLFHLSGFKFKPCSEETDHWGAGLGHFWRGRGWRTQNLPPSIWIIFDLLLNGILFSIIKGDAGDRRISFFLFELSWFLSWNQGIVLKIQTFQFFILFNVHLRTSSSSSLATFNVARLFKSLFFFACRSNMDLSNLPRSAQLTRFLWNCSKLPAMIGMGRDMTSTPQIAHMLPTSWILNIRTSFQFLLIKVVQIQISNATLPRGVFGKMSP